MTTVTANQDALVVLTSPTRLANTLTLTTTLPRSIILTTTDPTTRKRLTTLSDLLVLLPWHQKVKNLIH